MTFNKSNVIVSGSRSSLSEYANYTTVYPKPAMVGGKIVLTQDMINKQNVKYIIKWNFNLNGETVTVPENCIFEFDGGTLHNGTVIGQDTFINDIGGLGLEKLFAEDIVREGTWRTNGGGSFEQVQSDWNQTNVSKPDYIKNKPTIPAEQVQSDWNQTDSKAKDFIKNKPNIPEGVIVDTELSKTSTNPVQNKVITEALENAGGNPDKPYDPTKHSGLGRKTLELKEDGSNVLTQEDFDETNTIYVIQYDFTLGEDITVPENCVVEFDGGSVNNGKFMFNGASIEGDVRGSACYGLAYKNGEPLLPTYIGRHKMSQVYDHAFYITRGTTIWHDMSNQCLAVTTEYIIVIGTREDDGSDSGLIAVFDRNFNFIGQCFMPDCIHSGGAAIKGDYVYIASSGTTGTEGAINKVKIETIITACRTGSRTSLNTITSEEIIRIPGHVACIDYDSKNKEFAVLAWSTDNDVLRIYDENFNLIRTCPGATLQYIIDNYTGVFGSVADTVRGTLQDIILKNGVAIINYSIWFNEISGFATNYNILIEVDTVSGLPVQILGIYDHKAGISETEGLFKDPDDPEVIWFTTTEPLWSSEFNERSQGCYIGRLSCSKELTTAALSSVMENNNSLAARSSYRCVFVDNKYQGFSTGNLSDPYKTLETALLMTGNSEVTRIRLQGSDVPYTVKHLTINNSLRIEGESRSIDGNVYKATLKADILSKHGYPLLIINCVVKPYTAGDGTIQLYNSPIEIDNVDFYADPDGDSYISSSRGIIASTSNITIYGGGCRFYGYLFPFDLWYNGTVARASGKIKVRNCEYAYRLGSSMDYYNLVSALDIKDNDSDVYGVNAVYAIYGDAAPRIIEGIPQSYDIEAATAWAANIMKKCTGRNIVLFRNNGNTYFSLSDYLYINDNLVKVSDTIPEIHQGRSNENILLKTSNFQNSAWISFGNNALASIQNVYIAALPLIKKKIFLTGGSQAIRTYFNCPSSNIIISISFWAKTDTSGSQSVTIVFCDYKSGGWLQKQITVSSTDWHIYTVTFVAADAVVGANATLAIVSTNTCSDVSICAVKAEFNSVSSKWTPNIADFPLGGTTENRPQDIEIGYQYFDISLSPARPIYWNGTNWVDATGTIV